MKKHLFSLLVFACLNLASEPFVSAQSGNFPKFPPPDVSTKMDHDQMMEQLGLTYPVLPSNESAPNQSPFHSVRSAYGLWTNYVNAWETNGDYYTGTKFYKPLVLHDLTGLNKDSWAARREKIFKEIQNIYGYIPQAASQLKIEWTISEPVEVKEVYDRDQKPVATTPFRQYTITGKIDVSSYPELRNAPVLSGVLRIPANIQAGKKTPVVINITWSRNGSLMPDENLWNTMSSAGIGVFYFDPTALQPDNGQSLTSYLIGLINKGNWRKPTDWGTLVAWSWGISRFIDYFEQDQSFVDAKKVALTGHSRYGKTALVAMAYEPRIAIASPSSSGAMGIAQSRRHWGEDFENCVWDSEYHWQAGNAMIYAGVDKSSTDGYMPRKVINMPVDAESLVALCAPRPIFIGSGSEQGDAWADPYGHYLTAVAASPVYKLLGKKGIVMEDYTDYNGQKIPMPVTDKSYLSGDIGYRRHNGGHDPAPNYQTFKEFILKYWK
jgi:hypothetical protein